jgi:hypothetical protein
MPICCAAMGKSGGEEERGGQPSPSVADVGTGAFLPVASKAAGKRGRVLRHVAQGAGGLIRIDEI